MLSSCCHFHFQPVKQSEEMLIHAWFKQAHVEKWFYGKGRENVFEYLHKYFHGATDHRYFLAYEKKRPVALFMTSKLETQTMPLAKWCKHKDQTLFMDALIGDTEYLGKGLAAPLVVEFLRTQFPNIQEVLVCLDASHAQAIHIYRKVGFEPLCEITPSYSEKPHLLMHLDTKDLKAHDYHLEWYDQTPKELEAALFEGLGAYAFEKKELNPIRPFSLSVKDSTGLLIGGITGAILYGSLHIDSLFIDRTFRKHGWGSSLLHKVEHMAQQNGATFATVHTMDWEALSFYQHHGYQIEFKREGYAKNSTMYLLRKSLVETA